MVGLSVNVYKPYNVAANEKLPVVIVSILVIIGLYSFIGLIRFYVDGVVDSWRYAT